MNYVSIPFIPLTLLIGIFIWTWINDSFEQLAELRREAVNRGLAKWVPDEDGECKFVWNEKEETK